MTTNTEVEPSRIRARSRRRYVLATAVMVTALAATTVGCTADSESEHASGRTVTIDHSLGSTEVTGTPQRIVALGSQWLDATEVFGVTPVGYVDTVAMSTGGTPAPWEPDTLKSGTAIDPRGDVTEQVAALNPDLILAPGFATDQKTYTQLSNLAPTIASLGTEQVESWDQQVEIMGRLLDKETEATEIINGVNSRIDALARKFPDLKGKTFATAYLYSPTEVMVLADPNDGASALFSRLGLSLPQHLVDRAGGSGRIPLSTERIGELDADLLVMTTAPGLENQLDSLPGYSELPAVRKNAVTLIDVALATGINVPTPLSLPYVLDNLEPALANAATQS